MRHVLALTLVLAGAGWWASRMEVRGIEPQTPVATFPWRRTADGWRKLAVLAENTVEYPLPHPALIATAEVLAAMLICLSISGPRRAPTVQPK